MENIESHKSRAAVHQCMDSAELVRSAADVILKTRGKWMLGTVVPVPSGNGAVSKIFSFANVRGASPILQA